MLPFLSYATADSYRWFLIALAIAIGDNDSEVASLNFVLVFFDPPPNHPPIRFTTLKMVLNGAVITENSPPTTLHIPEPTFFIPLNIRPMLLNKPLNTLPISLNGDRTIFVIPPNTDFVPFHNFDNKPTRSFSSFRSFRN